MPILMRIVAFALVFAFSFAGVHAFPCPGGTLTPSSANGFVGCTSLTSGLVVDPTARDQDLDALSDVVVIYGAFQLENNPQITHINGLRSLQNTTGGFRIASMPALVSLAGGYELRHVLGGGAFFYIGNCDNLIGNAVADGFPNLRTAPNFQINELFGISTIVGFTNLNSCEESFAITACYGVVRVDGFNSLPSTYFFRMNFFQALRNVTGFTSLTHIGAAGMEFFQVATRPEIIHVPWGDIPAPTRTQYAIYVTAFANLVVIEGSLRIDQCYDVRYFGFKSLTTISGDGLTIVDSAIEHLDDSFPVLSVMGGINGGAPGTGGALRLNRNPRLTSLNGLERFTVLDRVQIENNSALVDATGLRNLVTITGGDLSIRMLNIGDPQNRVSRNVPLRDLPLCALNSVTGSVIIGGPRMSCMSLNDFIAQIPTVTGSRIVAECDPDINIPYATMTCGCDSAQCQNGGRCGPGRDGVENVPGNRCICPSPYGGRLCERFANLYEYNEVYPTAFVTVIPAAEFVSLSSPTIPNVVSKGVADIRWNTEVYLTFNLSGSGIDAYTLSTINNLILGADWGSNDQFGRMWRVSIVEPWDPATISWNNRPQPITTYATLHPNETYVGAPDDPSAPVDYAGVTRSYFPRLDIGNSHRFVDGAMQVDITDIALGTWGGFNLSTVSNPAFYQSTPITPTSRLYLRIDDVTPVTMDGNAPLPELILNPTLTLRNWQVDQFTLPKLRYNEHADTDSSVIRTYWASPSPLFTRRGQQHDCHIALTPQTLNRTGPNTVCLWSSPTVTVTLMNRWYHTGVNPYTPPYWFQWSPQFQLPPTIPWEVTTPIQYPTAPYFVFALVPKSGIRDPIDDGVRVGDSIHAEFWETPEELHTIPDRLVRGPVYLYGLNASFEVWMENYTPRRKVYSGSTQSWLDGFTFTPDMMTLGRRVYDISIRVENFYGLAAHIGTGVLAGAPIANPALPIVTITPPSTVYRSRATVVSIAVNWPATSTTPVNQRVTTVYWYARGGVVAQGKGLTIRFPANTIDKNVPVMISAYARVGTATSQLLANATTVTFTAVGLPLVSAIAGGAERTVNPASTITLSAAGSYDPDYKLPAAQLAVSSLYTFQWSCVNLALPLQPAVGTNDCGLGSLVRNTPTLVIPAFTLQSSASYRFTFQFSDSAGNGFRVSNDSAVVLTKYVVPFTLTASFQTAYKAGATVRVTGKANGVYPFVAPNNKPVYSWTVYRTDVPPPTNTAPINLALRASTPANSLSLSLASSLLSPGATYRFNVTELRTGAFSAVVLSIPPPPSLGTCTIDLPAGDELLTSFTVSCAGFTASLPTSNLLYRLVYVHPNTSQEIPITDWTTTPNKTTLLPAGFPLTVAVYAIDDYGTSGRTVAVTNVRKVTPTAGALPAACVVASHLSAGGAVANAIASGDVNNAAYLIGVLGGLLNRDSSTPTTAQCSGSGGAAVTATTAREELVSSLESILKSLLPPGGIGTGPATPPPTGDGGGLSDSTLTQIAGSLDTVTATVDPISKNSSRSVVGIVTTIVKVYDAAPEPEAPVIPALGGGSGGSGGIGGGSGGANPTVLPPVVDVTAVTTIDPTLQTSLTNVISNLLNPASTACENLELLANLSALLSQVALRGSVPDDALNRVATTNLITLSQRVSTDGSAVLSDSLANSLVAAGAGGSTASSGASTSIAMAAAASVASPLSVTLSANLLGIVDSLLPNRTQRDVAITRFASRLRACRTPPAPVAAIDNQPILLPQNDGTGSGGVGVPIDTFVPIGHRPLPPRRDGDAQPVPTNDELPPAYNPPTPTTPTPIVPVGTPLPPVTPLPPRVGSGVPSFPPGSGPDDGVIIDSDIVSVVVNNYSLPSLGAGAALIGVDPTTYFVDAVTIVFGRDDSECGDGSAPVETFPSCQYWSPENQRFQSDGCEVVASSEISGANSNTIKCRCSHLTDFASLTAVRCAALRSYIAFAVLYAIVAAVAFVQLMRMSVALNWKPKALLAQNAFIQHVLITLSAVFRVVVSSYYGSEPGVMSKGAVGFFTAIPYALTFGVFSLLIFQWSAINLYAMSGGNPFDKVRKPFIAVNVCYDVLVFILFLIVAAGTGSTKRDAAVGGSYVLAIISIIVGAGFLISASILARTMSKSTVNKNNSFSLRLVLIGILVAVCYILESAFWILSVADASGFERDSEKYTIPFFVFDVLMCAGAVWLFWDGVTGVVARSEADKPSAGSSRKLNKESSTTEPRDSTSAPANGKRKSGIVAGSSGNGRASKSTPNQPQESTGTGSAATEMTSVNASASASGDGAVSSDAVVVNINNTSQSANGSGLAVTIASDGAAPSAYAQLPSPTNAGASSDVAPIDPPAATQ